MLRALRCASNEASTSQVSVSEPIVRLGQIAVQRKIVARLLSQAVEVLQGPFQDELARGQCPGDLFEAIVKLEKERVRQLPHIVEASFGAGALGTRHVRFP